MIKTPAESARKAIAVAHDLKINHDSVVLSAFVTLCRCLISDTIIQPSTAETALEEMDDPHAKR